MATLVAAVASAGEEATEHRLKWTFPRFRPAEYVAAVAVMGTGFWLEAGTRGFPDNAISGPILLDEPTRDLIVARTPEARLAVAKTSGMIWNVTQFFPIADSLITPLATDRLNVDVAMQMTLINWQVHGITFLLTRLSHRVVGRTRPIVSGCEEDPDWDPVCRIADEGLRASFISGHASMSFASAGLTCSHHIAMPLYGGGFADGAICALTLVSATTVGTMRIVADKHWWSDVSAGAALGLATGFGLPWLLHYGASDVVSPRGVMGSGIFVLPLADPTTAGLTMMAFQ
jgi:membrane-associated phospholipid phosphatase